MKVDLSKHEHLMSDSGNSKCSCGKDFGHVAHTDDAVIAHEMHILELHEDPRVLSVYQAGWDAVEADLGDDPSIYDQVNAMAVEMEKRGWVYQG